MIQHRDVNVSIVAKLPRHVAQRIPPELERAILAIRRRPQAHTSPATRYSLIGATAIRAELKAARE